MPSIARTEFLLAANDDDELRWPDRDITDDLDYTFDLSDFLRDAGGDTITGQPTISSSPPDLVFVDGVVTATAATWDISGGTLTSPPTDYAITVVVMTAGGLRIERTLWMTTTKLSANIRTAQNTVVVQGPPGDAGLPGDTGPSGRSVATIVLNTAGTGYVFTFSDGTTATVPVPPASALPPTADQVSAALAALPDEQQLATLQAWASLLPNELSASPGQLIKSQDGYLRMLPTS